MSENGKEAEKVLFFENFLLALASLKMNKMRTLLTMLGIIIGIGAVICIDTLGNSLSQSIVASMEALGGNNINVGLQYKQTQTETNESGARFRGPERRRTMTEDDKYSVEIIEDIRSEMPGEIKAISYEASLGKATVTRGSEYANVSVTGINEEYFSVNSEPSLVSGEYISEQAYKEGKGVCMVSDYFCNNLYDGDTEQIIGAPIEITINGKIYTYYVEGVYEYSSSGMSMSTEYDTETNIYVPINNVFEKLHDYGVESFVIARDTNTGTTEDEFTESVTEILDKYYHSNEYYEPSTFSMSSMMEQFDSILGTVSIVISAIAAISLLVGGIGVMNIMLVSISERTREIGTRKALGATNGSIRTQFIVEAVVLCILGGVLGIFAGMLMGTGGVAIMNKYSEDVTVSVSFSISSVFIAVGFSLLIGVFFGYYPANKAAKMNPIDALRYE